MSTSMSRDYRFAIYAAVATFHFYRKDIVPIATGETYGSWAEKNKKIVDRVQEEILNLFNFELSHEQMGRAIKAYCTAGLSVETHPAARLTAPNAEIAEGSRFLFDENGRLDGVQPAD